MCAARRYESAVPEVVTAASVSATIHPDGSVLSSAAQNRGVHAMRGKML